MYYEGVRVAGFLALAGGVELQIFGREAPENDAKGANFEFF